MKNLKNENLNLYIYERFYFVDQIFVYLYSVIQIVYFWKHKLVNQQNFTPENFSHEHETFNYFLVKTVKNKPKYIKIIF